MNDYEKIYIKLKERLTDEEIVDAMLIPPSLNEEESEKSRTEFVKMRMTMRENRTEEEILMGRLLSLKYQIKSYLQSGTYDENQNQGTFVKKYIDLSGKSGKEIAEDIDLHPSRLSRILHGKEKFGKNIAYRLEKHSGELIPALYWWKLGQKDEEQEILTSPKERNIEYAKVKNKLIETLE